MLQKLPGFGCGRERRFRCRLFAPVPRAAQRTGAAVPGRRLAGSGAPAAPRHCRSRASALCLAAGASHHCAFAPAGLRRPGQALRGSSELHGWGDSNLYLRRKGSQLTLSTEHRAAPSRDHIPLQLAESGSTVALTVVERANIQPDTPTPIERVRQALAQLQEPIPVQQLQKLCGIRTATVCSILAQLSTKGEIVRDARGYQLKLPFPVSRPIDPKGNGNGKCLPPP